MRKFLGQVIVILLITVALFVIADRLVFLGRYGFRNREHFEINQDYYRTANFRFDTVLRSEVTSPDSYEENVLPTTFPARPIIHDSPPDAPFSSRTQSDIDYSRRAPNGLFSKMFSLESNVVGRSIAKWRDGTPIYDIEVRTDEFGRRTSLNPSPKNRTRHAVFFGCSFTYGEGRLTAETIPSQVALRSPKYHVYNYGVPGAGIQEISERIHRTNLRGQIKEPEGFGLYLFIPDHVRRAIPSIYFAGVHGATEFLEVGDNGEVVRYDNYAVAHPFKIWVYKLLGLSQILHLINIDFPLFYTEKHYSQVAHLIANTARAYKNQYPNDEFYVVTYPYDWAPGMMENYLAEDHVKVLNYEGLNIGKYLQGPAVIAKADGHPSAEANALLADQIVKDLKLDQ